MSKSLIRIESSYFVAGIVIDQNGQVVKAAPIVKYMVGWNTEKVETYCKKRGWKGTREKE